MKIYFAAAALAVAFPAAAFAQAAPTPAPKAEKACCCEKMGRKMDCCDMHEKKGGDSGHDGHDKHGGSDGHSGHKGGN